MKNLRTASLRSNLTGSYIKKSVYRKNPIHRQYTKDGSNVGFLRYIRKSFNPLQPSVAFYTP